MSGARPVLVGVDVGGTFTDLVLARAGTVQVAKVPSTPDDQAAGILEGLTRLDVAPEHVTRFAHGTTVATNTVLERDGARTVFVSTAGFADVLHIARQDRPHLYDLSARRADPLIARGDVVEVDERIGADGEVVAALADAEVDRVTAAVGELAPQAVAVSLLFGFLEPRHEERIVAALRAAGHTVTSASTLLPVLREVERGSTAVLNAYVAPRMSRYLGSLSRQLRTQGLRVDVEVMRSGGGTFATSAAEVEPVHTLLSGPAAGAWGAAALGAAVGARELIAFDVGGTSTDVTLIEDARPATTADGHIGGLPFAVSTTAIHTIGAGGGSVAWCDAGGALRVGPRSAGARPGPACYGAGGVEPTLSDADLLLGRLDAEVRLGGSLALDAGAAYDALSGLAAELGLDPERTAEGVVHVADAQMAKALRVVSVERGRDPRDFALLAFGGAGPLHQAALADELGCRHVIVPPNPGVLSATGLLAAPITAERARSVVLRTQDVSAALLADRFGLLADEARDALRAQGSEPAELRHTAELRYRGQAFELGVEVDSRHADDVDVLVDGFHAAHLQRYGYDQQGEDVELVTLRVRAEGPAPQMPLPPWTAGGPAEAAVVAHREVICDGERLPATVVDRTRLGAGSLLEGPAVVLGVDATVWVAPWQRGETDGAGVLHLGERPVAAR